MTATDAVKTERFTLLNRFGWKIVYHTADAGPDYNAVTVTRSYRGRPAGDLEMDRDGAREHFAAMERQGFERF